MSERRKVYIILKNLVEIAPFHERFNFFSMKKSITEYSDREENFIYGTNVPILPMTMGH